MQTAYQRRKLKKVKLEIAHRDKVMSVDSALARTGGVRKRPAYNPRTSIQVTAGVFKSKLCNMAKSAGFRLIIE